MITHFNKNELLNWLDQHAPTKSVQRALSSGQPITILGGFKPLPNSNSPGWIVLANSKAGREYYIAIAVNNFRDPRAYLIDYIDWASYTGGTHPLYKGDIPEYAEEHKQLGTIERVNENGS